MKSLGIVRQMDNLGRIVIPIELRKSFDIEPRDSLEIFTEGDKIVLQKYQQTCTFCGSVENLITFDGKFICAECAAKLKDAG
ncbi:MAG: AbrB/MazE/SpoVT family DNA-binding domain-containing protein [Oscillospiraceae bacterium]|jgi:transcriptional pleiotropic regulator of transition state genes|nr:AbrB/MazE/SpoVT family DNA-binding domain-containing protein [Oscillospiraceae bacterium]